ncbi:conjugal transfer protein TraD [Sphingomonas sp. BT-65]|uniref:conjugal transfer protein TraD n=1 Tax=Sphingomonas sp. BT-65 TaxID=2989821 RepID=UPI0022363214|nr:conjugal transfer protein TraD [Sphingomonas sp. BT-65]MCW4463501.1 conjugal transfer protein TraD [Sphingomonas sp. BT-65]
MRKPRDFDSELKTLADKAKQLKERQVRQFGELVVATGADALDADQLAGALLEAVATKDDATKEGWRERGAAFFRPARRSAARGPQSRARSAPPDASGSLPFGRTDRAS